MKDYGPIHDQPLGQGVEVEREDLLLHASTSSLLVSNAEHKGSAAGALLRAALIAYHEGVVKELKDAGVDDSTIELLAAQMVAIGDRLLWYDDRVSGVLRGPAPQHLTDLLADLIGIFDASRKSARRELQFVLESTR